MYRQPFLLPALERRHTAQAIVFLNLLGSPHERDTVRKLQQLDRAWAPVPHVRHIELRDGHPVMVFTKEPL